MTIDMFNKLTGHETLHPQICMIDLSKTNLSENIRIMCDFYGLLYYNSPKQSKASEKEWLRLVYPVRWSRYPRSNTGMPTTIRVCFSIPTCCAIHHLKTVSKPIRNAAVSRGALTEHEQQIITDNLREIGEELHHAIDRYSASIIASHIELLLNYCVRFCSQ